jgi:ATP-dependent protease ClpP protease subunit
MISISACFGLFSFAADADVRVKRGASFLDVWITGEITSKDANAVSAIEHEIAAKGVLVWLNSAGGNVDAAMSIGRVIRKHDGHTIVGPSEKCNSSCALVFIAGVYRVNFGDLGLHRPYLASAPQIRTTLDQQVPSKFAAIRDYVIEMGITDNFFQQMVNTEPSKMANYDYDTYTKLIPTHDPLYQDTQISQGPRTYAVTTDEMRRRETGADKCYEQGDEWLTCLEAINWGFSTRVYHERISKADDVCEATEAELRVASSLSRMELAEHPFLLKLEMFGC